ICSTLCVCAVRAIVCRTTAAKVTKATNLFSAPTLFLFCPLCAVRYARTGKIHCDYWRGCDARRSGDVERFRAKMVGTTTRGRSDRARTFFVLFSHRHVHHSHHCLEFAPVALLNLPALISHNVHTGHKGRRINLPGVLGFPLCPSCEILL